MRRTWTLSLSPVNPAKGVSERNLHVFDKDQNETVTRLDPSVTSYDGELDDAETPGSCYLVDINDAGESEPSPALAIIPPAPGPGPSPGVPETPTILGITYTN